jgi:hypothetical protein
MVARPGEEPLWHVIDDPAIFASTCVWPEISLNRRLPGTFQRVLGLLARRADEQSSNRAMDKTGRAVISGSRLFNTVFGLPRHGENITRSLGTFQSGSPPARTSRGQPRTKALGNQAKERLPLKARVSLDASRPKAAKCSVLGRDAFVRHYAGL